MRVRIAFLVFAMAFIFSACDTQDEPIEEMELIVVPSTDDGTEEQVPKPDLD